MYYLPAIVAVDKDGAWEAWIHNPHRYSGISAVGETREAAMAALQNQVRERAAAEDHWLANGSVHALLAAEIQGRRGVPPEIRFFDPAKHFRHCDTGFCGPATDRKFVTFLAYVDGQAKVMDVAGNELLVDPLVLSPSMLRSSW